MGAVEREQKRLKQVQEDQAEVLARLYELSREHPGRRVDVFELASHEVPLDPVPDALAALITMGLVAPQGDGFFILQPVGFDVAEEVLSPDYPEVEAAPVVNNHFNGTVGVVQNGAGSRAKLKQNRR